jgi:hypothetical protein
MVFDKLGAINFGSFSGAFEGAVRGIIQAEIDRLPHYMQVFLTVNAVGSSVENVEEALGGTWMEGTIDLIIQEVNARACSRNLGLIGPQRTDMIAYELDGSGIVWSALSHRDEASEIIRSNFDYMLNLSDDLSAIGDELVNAYLDAAKEKADDLILADFFENFEISISEINEMLLK